MFGQFWQRKSSFIKPNDQFKGQFKGQGFALRIKTQVVS